MKVTITRKRTAGGVLAIVCGLLAFVAGIILITDWVIQLNTPVVANLGPDGHLYGVFLFFSAVFTLMRVSLIIIGFFAILGGLAALHRTSYGWAKARSICALIGSFGIYFNSIIIDSSLVRVVSIIIGLLAILSIVFIDKSRNEFIASKSAG